MNKTAWLLACTALLLLQGCATQPSLYYWGRYEFVLENMYATPDEMPTEKQIRLLTEDIKETQRLGKKSPPGVYGHLAWLYALQGDKVDAEAAFKQEKTLYPESAVWIDGMMQRAAANAHP